MTLSPMPETRASAPAREAENKRAKAPALVGGAGDAQTAVVAQRLRNPRAGAPAREGKGIIIRRVYAPPGDRRTPLVFVTAERAGLRMVFGVARLRGGTLEVRPPRGPDGTGEGVWLPARERERIGAAILAAVEADPEVWAVLRP